MFAGRKKELADLEGLYSRDKFELAVVYGRRRVGKTTLIREFCKGKRALFFTALEQADADNLADFSAKVAEFFGLPEGTRFDTWKSALSFVGERAKTERFVLVFDEFPYAAQRNESLPSVLQVLVDHDLKDSLLFLVLCGSNQGFMESEVLGRKSPLFGRRTAQMKVGPLSFREARDMLPGDVQEAFRFYGCFGGIPYYLEQIDSSMSFRENLQALYFHPVGFLFDEPMSLLRQETREPAQYASILRALAGGANRPTEVADKVGMQVTAVSKYLQTLRDLGIVERRVPFGANPETSKKGVYCLKDACFEFWFKFVMPRVSEVEEGLGPAVAQGLPEQVIDEYLGHRFEALCKEWLVEQGVHGNLPIPVTAVGSWWGTNPSKREQDDIDVVAADTYGKKLLMGECKYRNKFDVAGEVADLVGKKGLIKDYATVELAIFSKYELDGADRFVPAGEKVEFVSLDRMYGA